MVKWYLPLKYSLATVFVPVKPLQPSVMQHCNLVDPFISYEENEVLRIQTLVYKI